MNDKADLYVPYVSESTMSPTNFPIYRTDATGIPNSNLNSTVSRTGLSRQVYKAWHTCVLKNVYEKRRRSRWLIATVLLPCMSVFGS